MDLLGSLVLKGTIKTSSRAAAIRCLGEIAATYCFEFCKYFFTQTQPQPESPPAEHSGEEGRKSKKRFVGLVPPLFAELLDLLDYPDPLIRGNICHVLGDFLKGFLTSQLPVKKTEFDRLLSSNGNQTDEQPKEKSNIEQDGAKPEEEEPPIVDLEKLIGVLLSELSDESANTCAMACRAIEECFPAIANSHLALTRCLEIVETVLRELKAETYWLIKTEVFYSFISFIPMILIILLGFKIGLSIFRSSGLLDHPIHREAHSSSSCPLHSISGNSILN